MFMWLTGFLLEILVSHSTWRQSHEPIRHGTGGEKTRCARSDAHYIYNNVFIQVASYLVV